MFKIEDGRSQFYQWDLNRKLIVEDPTITEVHFCNRTDNCSLVCETYTENGLTLVNVPNLLLQTDWKIHVYAYVGYTKHDECFEVKSRTKPADYIYTETEIKRYEDFENRIEDLEDQSKQNKNDIALLIKQDEALTKAMGIVDSNSKIDVIENTNNSHRNITLRQNGNGGDKVFDCAGKQCGGTGQSWYLTDYTNSSMTGDYSASLGFDNDSIGNGNIIGGIKNDITGRGCLSIGEKNIVSDSLGTGSIIGGTNNTVNNCGAGSLIAGKGNYIYSTASGAIIGGYYGGNLNNNTLFALGNGTSSKKSNAFEIKTNGEIIRKGVIRLVRAESGEMYFEIDGTQQTTVEAIGNILKSYERRHHYEWRIEALSETNDGYYTNTVVVNSFVEVDKKDGTKEIRLIANDNIRIFIFYFHYDLNGKCINVTSTGDKLKDIILDSII